jgi:hypothetical protein
MRGAYVIMTARDPTKGEEAKAENAANGAPEANMKVMQVHTAAFREVVDRADPTSDREYIKCARSDRW